MPAENVAVRGAPLFQGILQGAGDVLLSDDLGELLRTVFACQDGVTHAEELIIRDMGLTWDETKIGKTGDPGGVQLSLPVVTATL